VAAVYAERALALIAALSDGAQARHGDEHQSPSATGAQSRSRRQVWSNWEARTVQAEASAAPSAGAWLASGVPGRASATVEASERVPADASEGLTTDASDGVTPEPREATCDEQAATATHPTTHATRVSNVIG
jgi:hypothetical protein